MIYNNRATKRSIPTSLVRGFVVEPRSQCRHVAVYGLHFNCFGVESHR